MDLDTLTVPDDTYEGREVFDPVNAWPDASSRIFVSVYRSGPTTIFQLGYDPEDGRNWVRPLKSGEPFGPWQVFGAEVEPQKGE
jgi:hypothetical protein